MQEGPPTSWDARLGAVHTPFRRRFCASKLHQTMGRFKCLFSGRQAAYQIAIVGREPGHCDDEEWEKRLFCCAGPHKMVSLTVNPILRNGRHAVQARPDRHGHLRASPYAGTGYGGNDRYLPGHRWPTGLGWTQRPWTRSKLWSRNSNSPWWRRTDRSEGTVLPNSPAPPLCPIWESSFRPVAHHRSEPAISPCHSLPLL